jgi:hypothetical protein
MTTQVLNRVNDVRDLCEKRCEQLRHLIKPIHRTVQRVHPLIFPQNESSNLTSTTTPIIQVQINEHFDKDSIINHNIKMDKKQRYEDDFKIQRLVFVC